MDQNAKLGIGAVLMVVGTVVLFLPLFEFAIPLPAVGAAVLVLALGTLLVGISSIREGEHTV
ncbi:hypothetical protein GJ629_12705 [Halapricum sp. CBA1109]|jgi:dipeptide/tripeptide permease|uniref:hypothetical protein n=1 Tax=Halapricum sp. CBA1109 TaxID=2668068 RepID=UPI0012F9814A|nr:hypothetical protein [Halapricum sp. CBA1109]MUV90650.1 hypothetical protein [Halapricum sp. CBA1109]